MWVNIVYLQADRNQGADLFLRREAEAARCLMSPLGRAAGEVGWWGAGGDAAGAEFFN